MEVEGSLGMLGRGSPELSSGLGEGSWAGRLGLGGGPWSMMGRWERGGLLGFWEWEEGQGPGKKLKLEGVFYRFRKLSVYTGPL